MERIINYCFLSAGYMHSTVGADAHDVDFSIVHGKSLSKYLHLLGRLTNC